MALTDAQKKLAVGGSIGASALLIGYLLFRGRSADAGSFLPGGRSHEEHAHRKKHRHPDDHGDQDDQDDQGDQDDQAHKNERGEYGRKKKPHHRGHNHG